MAFRAEVRRALAAPLGGPLGRRVPAAAVTAIVADGRGGDRDLVALSELMDALVRAGVPRGRQFVLLADLEPPVDAARELARRWRDTLGVAVIPHDPARPCAFVPGAFADGTEVAIDDELREAELVLVAGLLAADPARGVRGGPAASWPGLADLHAREAEAGRVRAFPPPERAAAALERALEAHATAPALFALAWSAHDPPRVLAGEPLAVWDRARADGWIAPHPA